MTLVPAKLIREDEVPRHLHVDMRGATALMDLNDEAGDNVKCVRLLWLMTLKIPDIAFHANRAHTLLPPMPIASSENVPKIACARPLPPV